MVLCVNHVLQDRSAHQLVQLLVLLVQQVLLRIQPIQIVSIVNLASSHQLVVVVSNVLMVRYPIQLVIVVHHVHQVLEILYQMQVSVHHVWQVSHQQLVVFVQHVQLVSHQHQEVFVHHVNQVSIHNKEIFVVVVLLVNHQVPEHHAIIVQLVTFLIPVVFVLLVNQDLVVMQVLLVVMLVVKDKLPMKVVNALIAARMVKCGVQSLNDVKYVQLQLLLLLVMFHVLVVHVTNIQLINCLFVSQLVVMVVLLKLKKIICLLIKRYSVLQSPKFSILVNLMLKLLSFDHQLSTTFILPKEILFIVLIMITRLEMNSCCNSIKCISMEH